MKAVVLIGGEGTRLKPLTCNTPKAMVPILNRPFLEHLLRYLEKHGVRDVILAMGYLPDSIQSYFGDGEQFGVRLTYLVEKSPLGTAGAVKNAESLLDGTFVVVNGDILTEIDLSAMMNLHHQIKPKASIALTPVDDPTSYGVVETDARSMVERFIEKPGRDKVTSNMINAGIYILEPGLLAAIPPVTRFMFEHHVFPKLLQEGEPILGYCSDAYWIDIGTPEKYLKANHDLLRQWDESVRTEGKSQIHPAARVEGPALFAEGCVIARDAIIKGPAVLGPRCSIARGAAIDGAVLWADSRVGEAAVLKDCIIGSRSYIQEGCQIPAGCIVGDNTIVGRGSRLAPGAKVGPDASIEPNTRYS